MRRFFSWGLVIALLVINEWAFRILFPLPPIDLFMRLMVLVLTALFVPLAMAMRSERFIQDGAISWIGNKPRSTAIWLGLFVSYCVLMTAELSARYYFKHHYNPPYVEQKSWQPALHLPDPELGHHLHPDTTVTHTLTVNDSLIYEVDYTIDGNGRRVVSENDSTRNGGNILIDGCSFAFGWGVADSLTLSAHLSRLKPTERIYNLATSGYGVQQVFMHSKDSEYLDDLDDPLTVYYLFIDEHVRRLNGSRRLMGLWAQQFPYLTMEDGNVVNNGSFQQARFWKTLLWKTLGKSALIWTTDLDIPWYDSDEMIELTAQTLRATKTNYHDSFPASEFVVVIAPGSKNGQRLIPLLEEEGVAFLDLSGLLDPSEKQYRIHWTEAHPNGLYYQELANAILDYEYR